MPVRCLPAMLRIFTLLLLVGACANSHLRHKLDMPGSSHLDASLETGQLALVFSREARNVVVAVDGTLVAERERAKKIQISGVETGYVNVSIAADGVERSSRVWISSGKTTALPVGNPGSPQGMHPLLNTGLSIVAFLISRAATDYLF